MAMREHPGYMNPLRLKVIKIDDGLAVQIDPEFEARRVRYMRPLVDKYGLIFPQNVPFDDKYPRLNPRRRCYDNAMTLALDFPELIYCEGYMVFAGPDLALAMPHGFCVTQSGKVVDPTCSHLQHDRRVIYKGVKIKTDYMVSWYAKHSYYGVLDGHPALGDTVGVWADSPDLWLVE